MDVKIAQILVIQKLSNPSQQDTGLIQYIILKATQILL